MPRGNPQNLRTPTTEEARRIGAMGGKASAESRRKKVALRDCLIELLEKPNSLVLGDDGAPLNNATIMAIRAVQSAVNGDWKAWELVRDTAGQKPVERMVIADVDAETLADVERMVEGAEDEEA